MPRPAAALVEADLPRLGVADRDGVTEFLRGGQGAGGLERLTVREKQIVGNVLRRGRRLHDPEPDPAQPIQNRPDDLILGLRLVEPGRVADPFDEPRQPIGEGRRGLQAAGMASVAAHALREIVLGEQGARQHRDTLDGEWPSPKATWPRGASLDRFLSMYMVHV